MGVYFDVIKSYFKNLKFLKYTKLYGVQHKRNHRQICLVKMSLFGSLIMFNIFLQNLTLFFMGLE